MNQPPNFLYKETLIRKIVVVGQADPQCQYRVTTAVFTSLTQVSTLSDKLVFSTAVNIEQQSFNSKK